ncbi:hypothetical protein CIP107521_00772 [Corynebacterium diphtheriae]|nr:hypothetical protein CIP107521_00772 [Corynebacterium diphtheriae]
MRFLGGHSRTIWISAWGTCVRLDGRRMLIDVSFVLRSPEGVFSREI